MKRKIFLAILFLSTFSCTSTGEEKSEVEETGTMAETKFDEIKWKTKKDLDYPFREEMLDDLISNHLPKELKRGEILDLLGQPDRIDSSYLFYRVFQKRIGFFPLHTTTLVIKLSPDSTINWVKIHK